MCLSERKIGPRVEARTGTIDPSRMGFGCRDCSVSVLFHRSSKPSRDGFFFDYNAVGNESNRAAIERVLLVAKVCNSTHKGGEVSALDRKTDECRGSGKHRLKAHLA